MGGCSDIAETPEMLCIRPTSCTRRGPEVGHVEVFDDALMERIFRAGFRAVTPKGILGDARGARQEISQAWIAHAADPIVRVLEA